MMDYRVSSQPIFIAATASRKFDGKPEEEDPLRSPLRMKEAELCGPLIQPQRNLPLNMVISEPARRDTYRQYNSFCRTTSQHEVDIFTKIGIKRRNENQRVKVGGINCTTSDTAKTSESRFEYLYGSNIYSVGTGNTVKAHNRTEPPRSKMEREKNPNDIYGYKETNDQYTLTTENENGLPLYGRSNEGDLSYSLEIGRESSPSAYYAMGHDIQDFEAEPNNTLYSHGSEVDVDSNGFEAGKSISSDEVIDWSGFNSPAQSDTKYNFTPSPKDSIISDVNEGDFLDNVSFSLSDADTADTVLLSQSNNDSEGSVSELSNPEYIPTENVSSESEEDPYSSQNFLQTLSKVKKQLRRQKKASKDKKEENKCECYRKSGDRKTHGIEPCIKFKFTKQQIKVSRNTFGEEEYLEGFQDSVEFNFSNLFEASSQ